jgi:NAD(P)-dependent dehydrogenase (short-subunit alcohol dehydrogenase family)
VLTLTGKTAIVTGGASGIGAAVCAALREEGIRVACLDRKAGGVADLVLECDVSDESSVAQATAEAVDGLGGLDYAFLNAGIGAQGPILDVSPAEWDRILGVNLRGVFLTLQQAARAMRDRGGGSIVVTSSSAGILADFGIVPYSVSKMGVRQLVRVSARELGPLGIRVNAVAPGLTRTALSAPSGKIPGFHEGVVAKTPLGRIGEPTDIAEAVLALFAMGWVTGVTLPVDGGMTLYAVTDMPPGASTASTD